jgi:uncharacterized protein
VFHDGATKPLDGTLDDYAFTSLALLELAEATGDRTWWDLGTRLAASLRARFVEDRDGVVVFFLAPAGESLLVHRPESHHDGAIPSGAGLAVLALLRLGLVAGDEPALLLAERYLAQRLAGADVPNAWAASTLLAALDFYLHAQVVVVANGDARDALISATRTAYAPTACLAGPWAQSSTLDGKPPDATGRARAFVCRGTTCSPPVTTPSELTQLLTRVPG